MITNLPPTRAALIHALLDGGELAHMSQSEQTKLLANYDRAGNLKSTAIESETPLLKELAVEQPKKVVTEAKTSPVLPTRRNRPTESWTHQFEVSQVEHERVEWQFATPPPKQAHA